MEDALGDVYVCDDGYELDALVAEHGFKAALSDAGTADEATTGITLTNDTDEGALCVQQTWAAVWISSTDCKNQ